MKNFRDSHHRSEPMGRKSLLVTIAVVILLIVLVVQCNEGLLPTATPTFSLDHFFRVALMTSSSLDLPLASSIMFSLLRQSFEVYVSCRMSMQTVDNCKSALESLLKEHTIKNCFSLNREDCVSMFNSQCAKRDNLDQLTLFYEQLYQFQLLQDQSLGTMEPGINVQSVVIVGAGPVGLLSALECVMVNNAQNHRNLTITVIEKRNTYSRNVWFDFYPTPYSVASDFLFSLGLKYQDIEYEPVRVNATAASGTLILMRCQILERFLSKVLFMFGVDILYGHEYKNHNDTHIVVQRGNIDTDLVLDFDLLVAADGGNSRVRSNANIRAYPVSEFDILTKSEHGSESKVVHTIYVSGLHQTALVLNLAPLYNISSGSFYCPQVKIDPETKREIDPWTPTFKLKGISAIFKRFYFGHCHIQILFENDLGKRIMDRYNNKKAGKIHEREVSFAVNDILDPNQQKNLPCKAWELDAYPWNDISAVLREILVDPPANIDELISMLQRNRDTNEIDMTLWNVVVKRASKSYSMMDNGRALILHGDAVSTAHFRLGVGVNNAFISFGNILSPYLRGKKSLKKIMKYQDERWNSLINYMASTMFWESYCGDVVFFNTEAKSKWQSNGDDHLATVWYRDHKYQSFEQFESVQHLLGSCANHSYSIIKTEDDFI